MSRPTNNNFTNLEICLEYGIDITGRKIYLCHPLETPEKVGDGVAEHVIKGLHYLDKSDGVIQLWINTPGGEVSDMFAIYDVMRACSNEVHTIGFGEVCSAGALILVGGDKRYATPHCRYMVHSIHGGVDSDGDLLAMESRIAAVRVSWVAWARAMESHTNHSTNYWLREMPDKHRELWLTAEQMKQKQHGIIDDIWPPKKETQ